MTQGQSASNAMFRGAFTAIITPFTDDAEAIDFDRLEANVRAQSEAGITGIVPCGTTGESPTLTEDEHHAVIERAIDVGKPAGLTVIAGAGSNNTKHAIELHRFAHKAGADASLQVNPYYNKPSQEGLCRHFLAIADSCDLPIVLYNIPGRTGVMLSIESIQRLAQHPNIRAIKDATGGLELAGLTVARTDLAVLSGDDPLTLPMGVLGGMGVISVIANLLPDRVAALCKAINTGDWEAAREVHDDLMPLASGLLKLDTNPVPVKDAMRLLGRDTGAVRLPLCRPSESVTKQIETLLAARGMTREARTPAAARA